MVTPEHSNNPIIDELIDTFDDFKAMTFPTEMPKPAHIWKDLIELLTEYKSHVIQQTDDYLAGNKINTSGLDLPHKLEQAFETFHIRSVEDNDYWVQLSKYKSQIQKMANLLKKCAHN